MTLGVLFATTTFYDLDIDQINVKTALFYGLINQFVYIQIFKRSEDAINKRIICKLLKAFYGLKQAPKL